MEIIQSNHKQAFKLLLFNNKTYIILFNLEKNMFINTDIIKEVILLFLIFYNIL
jgi:hypothetical protein